MESTHIGRFTLCELLGEGAAGVVYRASADGEQFALKLLRTDADPELRARFLREGRLARDLGDVRHVVPVLDAGEVDGVVFLLLPYYAGGSLAALLRRRGARALDETVLLAAALGRGLDALHERGMLHRDVKPSNVLLDEHGGAALADFGLALATDSTRLTRDGQLLGTTHYLAPELIEGEEATRATDIYALGCLLYECVTGAPPFAGRGDAALGYAHLVEAPPDPRTYRPELPPGVSEALLTALAKTPSARPTSGTALARMLHLASSAAPG